MRNKGANILGGSWLPPLFLLNLSPFSLGWNYGNKLKWIFIIGSRVFLVWIKGVWWVLPFGSTNFHCIWILSGLWFHRLLWSSLLSFYLVAFMWNRFFPFIFFLLIQIWMGDFPSLLLIVGFLLSAVVLFVFWTCIFEVSSLPTYSTPERCISWSSDYIQLRSLCFSFILPSNPLLRFTSTHMRAKVKILSSILCVSILIYPPMALPMLASTFWSQKWIGRLWRRTQTGILDTMKVFASNSENHGVIKRPEDPQNQGPFWITRSLTSDDWNLTIKTLWNRGGSHSPETILWVSNETDPTVWARICWNDRLWLAFHSCYIPSQLLLYWLLVLVYATVAPLYMGLVLFWPALDLLEELPPLVKYACKMFLDFCATGGSGLWFGLDTLPPYVSLLVVAPPHSLILRMIVELGSIL